MGAGVGVRKTIITRICGVVGSGNGKSLSLCPRSCSCVCACVRACALNEVNNFNEKQPTIHRSRRTYTEFTAAAVVQLQHVALDEGLARRLPGHRHRVVLRRTVIRYHAGRQRCCDGKCGICVWVLQFGFCGKSQCAKDGTETKQNNGEPKRTKRSDSPYLLVFVLHHLWQLHNVYGHNVRADVVYCNNNAINYIIEHTDRKRTRAPFMANYIIIEWR